jgi:hypothetical protein
MSFFPVNHFSFIIVVGHRLTDPRKLPMSSDTRSTEANRGHDLGGIAYSQNNAIGVNAFNESLQMGEDQEGLFIKPLMAMGPAVKQSTKMTSEGAGEYYWSLFIEPLQR